MDFHKELIAEFEQETASTRKILAAIPEDADFSWKPHTKSMTLGRLAGHLVETCGQWASGTLTKDKVEQPPDYNFDRFIPADKNALLADFDKSVAESKAALAEFSPEKWSDIWSFGMGDQVWIRDSKYRVFRTWVLNHQVHHRAQVGVYLRLLDAAVPGTYGPSADDGM